MSKNSFVLLGAGLVGSLMATFLRKRGHDVKLFEKRPDFRKEGAEGGRSINLALSHRGLGALDRVGLLDQVQRICLPMKGRMMHDLNGQLTFQPYGEEGQYINSISRSKLNRVLLDAAELAGAQTQFDEECINADLYSGIVHLKNEAGAHREKADFLIGADGAFSGIREVMRKTDRFNFSQYYLPHGYKELSIPPISGDFALDPGALHIWPREQYMLIALPNLDKSFTCTLFLPFEGDISFNKLNDQNDVIKFFEDSFQDVIPLMPELLTEFFHNPTSSLVTIKCYPWKVGKACLIGDASHAIVPFYGQGMNAGFEDCRLLDDLMLQMDFDNAFTNFQQVRAPNTDAIAELAFQNFVEMRDLVADREFLLRKEIEQKINQLFPEDWIPLYSRVTFSDQPYSKALEIGNVQRKLMDEVMALPNIEKDWSEMNFEQIIKDLKAQADLS